MSDNIWRIVDSGVRTAAENMAMDEAMLEAKSEFGLPPTLRFLRFSPSAVLVGYNQTVEHEIRTDFCKQNNIDINRRLTGGGAILFDPSQVGWEIIGTKNDPLLPQALPDLYAKLCNCIVTGLKSLGLEARFRPRNDIEVGGRKISGTGGTELYDGFLFQGTLLVDFDVELMLKTLRIPVEKLKRHEVKSARDRVTCLKELLGEAPTYTEIKSALIKGFETELGVTFEESELDPKELELYEAKLEHFRSPDWINKVKAPPGDKNLLRSGLRCDGGLIYLTMVLDPKAKWLEDIMITGDFFSHPLEAVQNLESVFRDVKLEPEKIVKSVRNFFANNEFTLIGVTEDDIVELVNSALHRLKYRELGFNLGESNLIFEVNDGIKNIINNDLELNILTPYCAKKVDCESRYSKDCDRCGDCEVGTVHEMADELGLDSEGICSFEDLEETLQKLKNKGQTMFFGCCCEEFYIRHKRELDGYGIPGVLLDIDSSTCYELGKALAAYKGEFENQTDLRMAMVEKLLALRGGRVVESNGDEK